MSIPRFDFACLGEYLMQIGSAANREPSQRKRVTSLKDYFRRVGDVRRAGSPELACRGCWMEDCYWRHGGYTRWVEEGSYICEVVVERFKCKFCGATESVLPCFAVPARKFTLKQIAEGIEIYAKRPITYRDEVKELGAVEQRGEKLPGPCVSQLFLWVALLAERAEALLLEVQARCVSESVPDEHLERSEEFNCPNAWKAQIPGKDEQLDTLAKVVSYGQHLFTGVEGVVLELLGMLFLKNVEGMQRIFASDRLWMPTPHRTKPPIF